MRVLLVEDNDNRARLMSTQLVGTVLVRARNASEAFDLLKSEDRFDVAFLDHDLSEMASVGQAPKGELTGTHVAEFIAAMPPEARPVRCVVHSLNPVGASRMMHILERAGIRAVYQPVRIP